MAANIEAEASSRRRVNRRLLRNATVAAIAALVCLCTAGQVSHASTLTPSVISTSGSSESVSAQAGTAINIYQLQIQVTVPSDLSDLTWTAYGQQGVRFSTKKLEAMGPHCASGEGPLGLARIGRAQDTELGDVVATFAHSYLYYAHAQATCSDDATAIALQTQQSIELKTALSTAVLTGPSPEITSDIVVVVNDTYQSGETATISLRNDGQVPYKYNPRQEACDFTFEAGSRQFEIPPATHCDLPGDDGVIAPGQTVQIVQWALDECTAPGFFCFAIRPLATGVYTISGVLDSVDGNKRAQFLKTVLITGPKFTSEIEVLVKLIVSDPPSPDGIPLTLQLKNNGQVSYSLPAQPACYLKIANPAGNFISIPQFIGCDGTAQNTIVPGQIVDAVSGWKSNECTEYSATSCLKTAPLAPGNYVVSGALWTADKQSYAEFSRTIAISGLPVSPTPKVLPRDGGPPADESTPWPLLAGGLAAIACALCFAFAARVRRRR